ncbi:ferredoxin [Phytomonospora endophytica]|uniref:Ferredoxin n=1 Tax=Phytomonospora endophytica TaxID=714109 RepID=A0A841FRK2_9ACTN|nr:(4Fe-4S)-binding protein [Phytomonospora endophytica]MBB6035179.1 ferredoxin [Phytomonospora endophytica]GIG64072.1 ferredoxin [Phytomonospora endophytica]
MRVIADREVCVGAGQCVLTEPDVFDQDPEDGRVLLLIAEPGKTYEDAVREACDLCPSGALSIAED